MSEEIIRFLIISGFQIVSSILTFILFKIFKPKAMSFKEIAYKVVDLNIVTAILKAESLSNELSGEGKLEYALDYLIDCLKKELDYSSLSSDQLDWVHEHFTNSIEGVLNTPRKKLPIFFGNLFSKTKEEKNERS